jgi:hypothetical protein
MMTSLLMQQKLLPQTEQVLLHKEHTVLTATESEPHEGHAAGALTCRS